MGGRWGSQYPPVASSPLPTQHPNPPRRCPGSRREPTGISPRPQLLAQLRGAEPWERQQLQGRILTPLHPASWLVGVQGFKHRPPPKPQLEAAKGTQLPPVHLGPAGLSPPWGPVGAPDTCTQLEGNWGEAGWGGGGSGWVLGPGSRDTSLHTRSPCQSKRLLEIVPKGPPQHHLGRRDPGKGGVGGGLQQSGCTGELGGSHQTTTLNACKSPCIPPHPQIRAGGIWGDTGSAAASSPPGPIPYPPSTCSQAGLSHRVPPSTSRMAPRSPCWLSVAPTAAPWGAHPTLRGRVGHLGYVPT